jgi:hypothetical protein
MEVVVAYVKILSQYLSVKEIGLLIKNQTRDLPYTATFFCSRFIFTAD